MDTTGLRQRNVSKKPAEDKNEAPETLIEEDVDETNANSRLQRFESSEDAFAHLRGSSSMPLPEPKPPKDAKAVSKDESRASKIMNRVIYGALMIICFIAILYGGHIYTAALVALIEVLLFRELVSVRYNVYYHIIRDTIPFFRTTQWMWFAAAIFYTYSDFVVDILIGNKEMHHFLSLAQWQTLLAFLLYSGSFVLTIATLQRDHIRFQMNQLCWTIVVLCLTVGQMKYVMHNIYNGLVWFALPVLLVVSNDIFAYVAGMTCGRKFINRPLIKMSPNKTWEGFIGGAIFTLIFGWYISRFLAQFQWMTCPVNEFTLFPKKLDCVPENIFHHTTTIFPSQVFELLPDHFVRVFPNIVEVCNDGTKLTPCVSGEATHTHDHFEFVLKGVLPFQFHALFLSLFASFVAPFGGFLASAIKRAYHIKDFDSLIPGHGGIMDRMDCQFLMALCTWVHYNAFVKIATVSVPKLLYMYGLLSEDEKVELMEEIQKLNA